MIFPFKPPFTDDFPIQTSIYRRFSHSNIHLQTIFPFKPPFTDDFPTQTSIYRRFSHSNLHLQTIFPLKPPFTDDFPTQTSIYRRFSHSNLHLQTIFPLKPPFTADFPCIFQGLAMKKHVNDPGVLHVPASRRSKLEGSIRCFGNLEPSFSRPSR